MNNSISPAIIIGTIMVIILVFNLGLIAKLKQGKNNNKNNAYHLLINSLKSPWQAENDALNELSKLVESNRDNDSENQEEIRKTEIKSSEE